MAADESGAASNPFDFEAAETHTPAPVTPARPAPPSLDRDVRQRTASRGQTLSWVALILGLVLSVLLGYAAFMSLVSIDMVSGDPLGRSFGWLTVLVLIIVGLMVALVLSIIALFRASPQLVATLALVLTVLLPWVAVIVGVKFGAEILAVRAQRDLAVSGGQVAAAIFEALADRGIDPGPFRTLLERLLG